MYPRTTREHYLRQNLEYFAVQITHSMKSTYILVSRLLKFYLQNIQHQWEALFLKFLLNFDKNLN